MNIEFGSAAFILSISWITAVTAGHTKRVTTQAVILSAYCVGAFLDPNMSIIYSIWPSPYLVRQYRGTPDVATGNRDLFVISHTIG